MTTKKSSALDVEAFLAAKRASDPTYGKCAPGVANATPLRILRKQDEEKAEREAEMHSEAGYDGGSDHYSLD